MRKRRQSAGSTTGPATTQAGPTSAGPGRGNAARQSTLNGRGPNPGEEKQGDWGDLWSWWGSDEEKVGDDDEFAWWNPWTWWGDETDTDTPTIDTPSPSIDTPAPTVDGPDVDTPEVKDEEIKEVIEEVKEVEEKVEPDLALRPESMRSGQYGALIQKGGGTIEIKESAEPGAAVKLTIADGTACHIKTVGGGMIEVAFRKGDKEETGWVAAGLFSDQPRLFKDDDNSDLMEDYTWTHFSGDQSMPEGADGRTVQQGGLADCYFVAAMNAVGMANPQFLRESIVYDKTTGMYKCRFFEEAGWDHQTGKPKTSEVWVEVDGYLPTSGTSLDAAYADKNDSTVWGAIYEKAYAKWKGGYNVMGDGGYGSKAMEEMTGNPSSYRNTSQLSEDEVIPFFEKAKSEGLAIYTGSNSTGKVETQTPLTDKGDGKYAGTVTQSHKWNHMEPGTVRIEDLSGNAGYARDTGREGDKKAGFRGAAVTGGEVVYKPNTIEIEFAEGKRPEAADQLQVNAEFKGMIYPTKQVIGWHGYSFDKVVDGDKVQLYNPWGSYQPKPLTPAEYLANYGSLSTAQVPQAAGES